MSEVQQISIKDYHYDLPENSIALHPADPRDSSLLLEYKEGQIASSHYRDLPSFLPDDTLLVMNNTRVLAARLLFEKSTGGVIEIFCLEPADSVQIEQGLMSTGSVKWQCMVGGLGKWKQPEISMTLQLGSREMKLSARIVERREDVVIIHFEWEDANIPFSEIMAHAGQVPLPPYLKRKAEAGDRQSYQTVYAQKQGSVAAPTAGLHFTERLLNDLKEKGVDFAELTLHVGAGTFLPVKSATMSGHNMHKEWIVVGIDLLHQLMESAEKNVIAVGTTSLRTLETLYWMGVKALKQPEADLHALEVQQWDPYQISAEGITKKEALNALAAWMRNKQMREWIGTTQLLIAPGYTIKMVDAILTNFHQPASTLLLLVAACIGEDWRKVYQYALENDYRFLSYGDGSLLWCRKDLP